MDTPWRLVLGASRRAFVTPGSGACARIVAGLTKSGNPCGESKCAQACSTGCAADRCTPRNPSNSTPSTHRQGAGLLSVHRRVSPGSHGEDQNGGPCHTRATSKGSATVNRVTHDHSWSQVKARARAALWGSQLTINRRCLRQASAPGSPRVGPEGGGSPAARVSRHVGSEGVAAPLTRHASHVV